MSVRLANLRLLAVVGAVACRPQTPPVIAITAVNYAFQAPATVAPGPARLRLINAGTVVHEVQVFVFKPGISADSGRALLSTMDHVPDSLADSSGAVLIAAAGTTAPEEVYVDLQAGRAYALLCQFRDIPTAKRHDRLGMFGALQVTAR